MILSMSLFLLSLLKDSLSLRCYSCSFSFTEQYDMEHRDAWCANESLILYETEQTSKICGSWEPYCVTSITTIQDAFTSVSRGCGERCSEYCESEGFGFDQVNCDDCCEEDLCNSNFSVQYYRDVFSRQHTSWLGPLPEELKWNNDSGIKFPFGKFVRIEKRINKKRKSRSSSNHLYQINSRLVIFLFIAKRIIKSHF